MRTYTIKLFLLLVFLTLPNCLVTVDRTFTLPVVTNSTEVINLFPKTIYEIQELTQKGIHEAREGITKIVSVDNKNRTFDNTLKALDKIIAKVNIKASILGLLDMVHPDYVIRAASQKSIQVFQKFLIDEFTYNKELYQAIRYYTDHTAQHEHLNPEELYFIKETLKGYKHAGLELPDEKQELLKKLKKELGELELGFETTIATDNKQIYVSQEELKGLSQEFVQSLVKMAEGEYSIGTDYPTYFYVLENCTVESTRKKLWRAFQTRGYPTNKTTLERIVALRAEIAKILGYESYAYLDIDNEMAQTPEKVKQFLSKLITRGMRKAQQEIATLKAHLPDTIHLVNGKFKPWDFNFVSNTYKKHFLEIDEAIIAQYFPLEHTLAKLLYIYEQFFGITFTKVNTQGLWHSDVEILQVFKDNILLGTVLLDLFPRPNKYTHACQASIVPIIKTRAGISPAVVAVIANFPKPTQQAPALLKRTDVITFFHEFGHALHSLLGITEMAGFSGTHVKTDFVEMPSQMLEQWMWDKAILKLVSKHYKTGEPLADSTIEKIEKLKHYDSGNFIQTQLFYSLFSLKLFNNNAKSIPVLWQSLHEQLLPYIVFDKANRRYVSFGHLVNYGAKYYGYLWSKVYALDLFEPIKQAGLLNRAMGEKYTQQVLAKGGSEEPLNLLRAFLGRNPNADAFFKDLGI